MREIRVYDENRVPAWTRALGPSEYAVFHVDAKTGHHRNAYGQRLASHWDRTCFVFDSLEEAEAYASEKVRAVPEIACKIYDHTGEAAGPVKTVVNEALRPDAVRRVARRHALLGSIFTASGLLGWWALWRSDWQFYLAALVGTQLMSAGIVQLVQALIAFRKYRGSSQ